MFSDKDAQEVNRFLFDIVKAYKLEQVLGDPGPTCDPNLFLSRSCCDMHMAYALFWADLTTQADHINERFNIGGKPYRYQIEQSRKLRTVEGVGSDKYSSCKTSVMSVAWYKALAETFDVPMAVEIEKLWKGEI